MEEIILVSSSRDPGGLASFDLSNGGTFLNFKNSISESGSILIGGSSSYSGLGFMIVCFTLFTILLYFYSRFA